MEDMNSYSGTTTLTSTVAGAHSGVEKVRLQLYAQGLPNVYVGALNRRLANPFAVVTVLANDPNEKHYILGRTEVIKNSCNPRWVTSFDMNYDFRRKTRINIGIYDKAKPNKEDIMGSVIFTVGEVLGSKGNIKGKHLLKGGSIFVRITRAPTVPDHVLTLCFRGIQIKNIEGIFGIVDPFFELTSQIISSGGDSESWQPVYRSKRIDNNLNPIWEQFAISTNALCDSDYNKPIQFFLWDSNKNGKHALIGSFEISVNGLLSQVNTTSSSSNNNYNNACTVRKNGKDFGRIIVVTAQINGPNSIVNNNSTSITTSSLSPPQQGNLSISNLVPISPLTTTATTSTTTSNRSNSLPPFSEALNYPLPLPPPQQKQSSLPSSSTNNNNHHNISNSTSTSIKIPLPAPQINSSISNAVPIPPLDTDTSSGSNTTASNTSNNLPPFSEAFHYSIPPSQHQQQQQQQQLSRPSSSSLQNTMNNVSADKYDSHSFSANNNTPVQLSNRNRKNLCNHLSTNNLLDHHLRINQSSHFHHRSYHRRLRSL